MMGNIKWEDLIVPNIKSERQQLCFSNPKH